MSAVTEASPKALAPQPRGGVVQSVRDSLVVAKRNLIRMMRIPNLVRPLGSHSNSPRADRRLSAGKGCAA
ncbi:hypothetical protein ACFQ7W_38095 [Streptomyces niveus]|uniref:hypothetical protein n=1 Tax=Streptomyces niveus TaxID=193462 RepID=UPI0036AD6D3D